MTKLLETYKDMANEQVLEIRSSISNKGKSFTSSVVSIDSMQDLQADHEDMKAERNTWALLLSLYDQTFQEVVSPHDPSLEPSFTVDPGREAQVIDLLFRRRLDLQRWNRVVDWLEHNSRDFTYHEVSCTRLCHCSKIKHTEKITTLSSR